LIGSAQFDRLWRDELTMTNVDDKFVLFTQPG
jgi:hypothetical protein